MPSAARASTSLEGRCDHRIGSVGNRWQHPRLDVIRLDADVRRRLMEKEQVQKALLHALTRRKRTPKGIMKRDK